MKKRIVIAGSSFAGYSTAVMLAKHLQGKHEIWVIDRKPDFVFIPSFVWFPFGYRKKEDISFDTQPIYNDLNIKFIEATIYGFDLEDQLVYTHNEDFHYDYLVVATGARPRYESIKGLKPGENSWSISDLKNAAATRKAWQHFLEAPGDMVIGAAQWAGYFFAAYEFLLNTVYQLHQHKLQDQINLHFVTPEPYLTHFGIGGLHCNPESCQQLFEHLNVQPHIATEIHQVKKHTVELESGEILSSAFTMIIPQFIGVDAVRTTRKLGDEFGLIKTDAQFRHPLYTNVFAAGSAVAIPQLSETAIGLGVPRTQSSSELMGKTVAQNILAELEGEEPQSITTEELYAYCRKDMEYLSSLLSAEERGQDILKRIAGESQDKWANHTMKRYIEHSFTKNYHPV